MQKSNRLIGCLSVSLLIAGCVTSQQGFVDNASNLKDVQVCRNYLADKKDLYAVSDDEKASIAGYSAALQREFFRRGLTETKCEGLVKDHNDKVAAGVAAAVVIGAVTYAVVKDAKECDADPKCRRSGGGGFSSARNSNNQTERARRGQPETAFGGAYAWDYYYDANGNEVKRFRSTETGQFSNNASCLLSPKNDATWPEKKSMLGLMRTGHTFRVKTVSLAALAQRKAPTYFVSKSLSSASSSNPSIGPTAEREPPGKDALLTKMSSPPNC